jgi:hypothetical protein
MPDGDARVASSVADVGSAGAATGRSVDMVAPTLPSAPPSTFGAPAAPVPSTVPELGRPPVHDPSAPVPATLVSGPPVHPPAAPAPRRARGVLIGVLAVAAVGGGVGIYAATRPAAATSPPVVDPEVTAREPTERTRPSPPPLPPPLPPPAPAAAPIPDPTLAGEVLTAPTFAIRLPVGAQALHTRDGSLGGTLDGVIFSVALIPPTLAQTIADVEKRTGLRLMDQHPEPFAGHDYTVLEFAGMLHDTTTGYVGVGVAFLDRDPAIGATVLFPADLATDPHMVELVAEFLHRRIALAN